jgi:CheY-like chemotaxis protein
MSHQDEIASASAEILGDAAALADAVVAEDMAEARFLAALVVMKARQCGHQRVMAAATAVVVALGMDKTAPLPELGLALLHLADELGSLEERKPVAHPDIAWVTFSARRSMATAAPGPAMTTSPRVLIVEDDAALTDTLVQALALTGTTVVGCARDARTACDMLSRDPTVVLIDYTLLDGPCDAFIDHVRATGFPVAMLTGLRPNELPTRYRQLPILTKPYGIDALSALVERLG